ncbi:hypothetical protein ACEPAF_6323 [Sanghuangporus sanghuang]
MDPEQITTAARHLLAVKQYTTASYGEYFQNTSNFTRLNAISQKAFALYEYFITLDREIDTFWRRKFTFPTALWFLNRYTLYFSLFPTLIGFHVPFSQQIISNVASGLTLSLRVYALYGQAWWVIVVLFPFFISEIALESWAVDGGVPVPLPSWAIGCILTGKSNQGIRFAVFWMGQLIFPTLIFIMTIARAVRLRRYGPMKGGILNVMLRDGVMYFLVIFIVNLANVVTYIVAPVDLKFANAPFTNVITTVMICRLMLNLKRANNQEPVSMNTSFFSVKGDARTRRTLLVGDLGEDIDINDSNDKSRRRDYPQSRYGHGRGRAPQNPGYELEMLTEHERQ